MVLLWDGRKLACDVTGGDSYSLHVQQRVNGSEGGGNWEGSGREVGGELEGSGREVITESSIGRRWGETGRRGYFLWRERFTMP